MAESHGTPENAVSVNSDSLNKKISCIQIDPDKTTKIVIKGGINAIGDGAKVLISQASVEAPARIWWMVQKPVASFTGRSSELEQLHQKVTHGGMHRQTLIADKVSAVTGLGGIGKSELARMYAYEKGETFFNGNVVWINAEDTSSMTSSFCGLADYLGVETRDGSGKLKNITSILTRVYDHFKNRRALFIFDNAELLATTKPFLPLYGPAYEPPYVLLTSRNREWGENVTKLELDMLSEDEAVELIFKCLSGLKNFVILKEDAKNLADKLHCFPLALQQAVGYIKKYNRRRKFTINDYLTAFESKTKELLSFPISESEYVKTVYITWQVTFDKLNEDSSNKLAIDILGMIAYMHADDIPISTFLKLADNKEDDLWDALELLEQFSLIRRSDPGTSEGGSDTEAKYSIHRLVQTVLQLQLGPDKEDGYLEKALAQMEKFVKGRYGNFEADRKFLYHAMMVLEHGIKHKELLRRFCFLPVRIVDALLYQGRYAEALDYVKPQYSVMAKILGPKHHSTLALQFNEARSLHCIGKHQEAVGVYEEAAEDYSKTLGALHCDTQAARIDLAFLYIDLKQPKKSLEIFEDVYEKKKESESANIPKAGIVELYSYRDIFTVLYGIGHSLQLLERYSEAESYYRIVYDKRKISDGEYHARTLHAANKIAEALKQQKKYNEAFVILNNVYEKQKEKIGDNHPHTLVTEANIVSILIEQKNTEEALRMLFQLYEKKIAVLGENHKIVLQLKAKIDGIRDRRE